MKNKINKRKISYKSLLAQYEKMDDLYRQIIYCLYKSKRECRNNSFSMSYYEVDKLIKIGSSNELTMLDKLQNKCGVYIFLDKGNTPVYIGVAAKIDSKHSLKDRLQKQLNSNTNSTLSLNINEYEKYNYGLSQQNDFKKLILEYAPKLITISMGKLKNKEAINRSLALEKILIALLDPEYNK